MIDVKHQISEVERTVGSRVLDAGTARIMTIAQTYAAEVEDVWEACTDPERIPRWFLPVTGDLRIGGRYQLEGNAGGEVLTCDPPKSFTATWEYDGDVSWIECRFTAIEPGRTRFELEHAAHVDDETWAKFGPGAVGIGWDLGLLGLGPYLGGGADLAAIAEWSVSEDAKEFVRLAGERWYEADVAGGTDSAVARAAADQTREAYLAPPDGA